MRLLYQICMCCCVVAFFLTLAHSLYLEAAIVVFLGYAQHYNFTRWERIQWGKARLKEIEKVVNATIQQQRIDELNGNISEPTLDDDEVPE